MKGGIRRKSCKAMVVSLAIYSLALERAAAAEFAYGVGYVGEHSSNITRTPTNEKSDWINTFIAGIAYRDIGPELATHVVGQVEEVDYHKDTFDDGPQYYLDAAAIWTISPRRLTWTLEDRYSQARLNVAAQDTPTNRVGANVFATGPDVFLRFGALNTMVIGARYGQMYFGGNDADNSRYAGYGRWLYQMDSATTVSLNYEGLKVEFDNDIANVNYTRRDAFLRLDIRPVPSHFTLDLGSTRIERERGDEVDGSLARLSWLRQINSGSFLNVTVSREYSDAAMQLLSTVTNPAEAPVPSAGSVSIANGQDVVSGDVFYARRAEVAYSNVGPQFGFNVRAFRRHFDYQISDQDRNETGGRVEITHNPEGTFVSSIYGEFQKTNFLNFVRDDNDRTLGVRLLYRSTRTLTFGLEGANMRRRSTDPSFEFTDTRVLVSVIYSSSSLFTPVRRYVP